MSETNNHLNLALQVLRTPIELASMDLVTGAIGSLLQKLGQLLKDEYDVQTGVRKKIESLSQELESVHAVLRKIGEVPPEQLDDQVRLWARDLREASYDMEDIVDDFLIMRADGPEPAAEPGLLKRLTKNVGKLFKKSKHRHKIAGAIQEINDKLQEVAARRGRYMVNDIPKPAVPATVDPRLQAMYMKASELVGMEEQMNELVKMLSLGNDIDLSSDKSMKIVSVVGFGGLGKTTLAKVVYDKFKLGFDCGAFVPVGMHPNMKKVLRDILIGLDKRMYMNSYTTSLDEKQLIDELHEILQIKSCFIVVDDIWDRSSWAVIRCALQGSKCRSRVLITTRIYEIARHAGGDVYKMKPLSYDESRKLLYTRILGDQSGSLPTPSAVACDIILKKCGGVPLVIITSVSLLANKPRECWSEMMISFDDLEHADMHHTPRIMCLSYYNLPLHLRPCLLYLSIFPEDYYIEKKMLIWRWVAEGFIQEKQEADIGLFEIGEGYFNELINRSLIQPVEDEYSGCVNGCRVHDIMLDIMCLLSAKENFVTIANASWEREIQRNNVRRLVLHNYWGLKESGHRLADMELKQLRTFVTNECSASDINKKLPSFQVLRVLETENRNNLITESEINLRHVGSLLHLRYLSLQKVDSSSLPEDVGNLKLLLVLDVQYSNIRDLPESVGQMTKLLCLRVDFDARVSPSAIGKLTSLQELRMKPRMDDRWQFVKVLGKLVSIWMGLPMEHHHCWSPYAICTSFSTWRLRATFTKEWASRGNQDSLPLNASDTCA